MAHYLIELRSLLKAHSASTIAKLLGKTERTVLYYTAENGAKKPPASVQETIHELFVKHNRGEPLKVEVKQPDDYQKEVITLLKEKNAILQKTIDFSLTELRENVLLARTLGQLNRKLLEEIVSRQRKVSLGQVGLETNKLFDEFYKSMKEGGIHFFDGK